MREPVWRSCVKVACLLVLAWDTSGVSGSWQWRVGYLSAALLLVVWRSTGRVIFLNGYAAVLGGTCLARMLVFVTEGDRWSGAALNLLLAMVVHSSLRSYRGLALEIDRYTGPELSTREETP